MDEHPSGVQIAEQATSIESNSSEISELKTMMDAFSVQLVQRDATIELLQGVLATATAERDARFTEDHLLGRWFESNRRRHLKSLNLNGLRDYLLVAAGVV